MANFPALDCLGSSFCILCRLYSVVLRNAVPFNYLAPYSEQTTTTKSTHRQFNLPHIVCYYIQLSCSCRFPNIPFLQQSFLCSHYFKGRFIFLHVITHVTAAIIVYMPSQNSRHNICKQKSQLDPRVFLSEVLVSYSDSIYLG